MQPPLEASFTILSYLYSIFLGQIISGLLVTSGIGWGKIYGDYHFAKPYVVFYFVVLDAVVCSVLIYFVSALLMNFLIMYPLLVYGLTLEIAFGAYVKTCHTLGRKILRNFRKYWKGVAFVQITSLLNFVFVSLLIYYKII